MLFKISEHHAGHFIIIGSRIYVHLLYVLR